MKNSKFEEGAEKLHDIEEEDDSPLPLVSANHQFAPQLRPEGPQPGPYVGPPAEEELGSQGGAQEENLLEGERSPRGQD